LRNAKARGTQSTNRDKGAHSAALVSASQKFESFDVDQTTLSLAPFNWQAEEKRACGHTASKEAGMAQRDQIAADICGQEPNKAEAQSTFDRLLRAYFATLVIGELPTTTKSDADHWSRNSEKTVALEVLS
jgi:hypothetical protein